MAQFEGRTVVIADDSELMLSFLEDLYTQIGFHVVGLAKDGIEALDLISEQKPDLVSLDIIMPNMDGIECMRTMRNNWPEQRYVLTTVLTNDPKIVECYREEIPAELFLPKQLTVEFLAGRLKRIYEGWLVVNPEYTNSNRPMPVISTHDPELDEDEESSEEEVSSFTGDDDAVPPPPKVG